MIPEVNIRDKVGNSNALQQIQYSLCVPTSVISRSNARNLQQATAVLYQIAKAASIYNVSEIVVMDTLREVEEPVRLEAAKSDNSKKIKFDDIDEGTKDASAKDKTDQVSEDAMIIATILQYFVTPPYLNKTIFKKQFHKNFIYAKNFPKLTTLPFMSDDVSSVYREGLTVTMGKISKPLHKSKKHQPLKNTKFVNIGHDNYLELQGQQVPVNVRVTVNTETKKVVSPIEAYKEQVGAKSSYGYHVRIAKTFSSVFTESSFPEGYTKSLWVNSGDYFHHTKTKLPAHKPELTGKEQNILLIVSKWTDIEESFKNDAKNLEGVSKAQEFFDGQVSIPSGTRIEDGALIALTKLSL